MHCDVVEAVADRGVISVAVVKALVRLPQVRCIYLQGTACSPTILTAVATSPNVSRLRELHLGHNCFHPGMVDDVHAGTNTICNLVAKMPNLVKLTLPPYADFERVQDAICSNLQSLGVRTAWGSVAPAGDVPGIDFSQFEHVCFAGLRELAVENVYMPNPRERFPTLAWPLAELERLRITRFTFLIDERRLQVQALACACVRLAPKLRVLCLPAAFLKVSLRTAVARAARGRPIQLLPA